MSTLTQFIKLNVCMFNNILRPNFFLLILFITKMQTLTLGMDISLKLHFKAFSKRKSSRILCRSFSKLQSIKPLINISK